MQGTEYKEFNDSFGTTHPHFNNLSYTTSTEPVLNWCRRILNLNKHLRADFLASLKPDEATAARSSSTTKPTPDPLHVVSTG